MDERAQQAISSLKTTTGQKSARSELISHLYEPGRPDKNVFQIWGRGFTEGDKASIVKHVASRQYTTADLLGKSRPGADYSTVVAKYKGPSQAQMLEVDDLWSCCDVRDLASVLGVDIENGLSSEQVKRHLTMYGSNSCEQSKTMPLWKIVVSNFKEPMVFFLVSGFILSLIFREWAEAGAIGCLVTINAIASTALERKAIRALESLASLAPAHCEVLRDGQRDVISSSDVVIGDILIVSSGSIVAADARVFEASEIYVNEALLTGESREVPKIDEAIEDAAKEQFHANVLYESTAVVRGSGRAIVFAVGENTQLGRIASELAKASGSVKRSPLEGSLHRLGGFIGVGVMILLVAIFIIAWLTNYMDPSHPNRNRWVGIIILAVGFAVAAIPASLPAVVTSCFAMGCRVLSQRNAQIRRLPAVETLGCTSVICTDKTGTLTQAQMTATDFYVPYVVNDPDLLLALASAPDRLVPVTSPSDASRSTKSQASRDMSETTFSAPSVQTGQMLTSSQLPRPRPLTDVGSTIAGSVKRGSSSVGVQSCSGDDTSDNGRGRSSRLKGSRNASHHDHDVTDESISDRLSHLKSDSSNWSASVSYSALDPGIVRSLDPVNDNLRHYRLVPANGYDPYGGIWPTARLEAGGQTERSPVFNQEAGGRKLVDSNTIDSRIVKLALEVARLAAPHTELQFDTEDKKWEIAGNMTDGAVVVAAAKAGWSDLGWEGHEDPRDYFDLDDDLSIPFTSTQKLEMAVYRRNTVTDKHLPIRVNGKYLDYFVAIKGAPEILFDLHTALMSIDREGNISVQIAQNFTESASHIDSATLRLMRSMNASCSSLALRVLFVALIPLVETQIEELAQLDMNSRADWLVRLPTIQCGLLACEDPPKVGVSESIAKCQLAGVETIMITGDQALTAMAIARKVDFAVTGVVDCRKLSSAVKVPVQAFMDDNKNAPDEAKEETDKMWEKIDRRIAGKNIFCRAKPEDKIFLVRYLQRKGHVVAMTGDGVNDAPALRAADIGVAMGITGTEVAKTAADMVLADDNFGTLVVAIQEGRRIFSNVQKFVAYLVGTVFAETFYLTVCILAGLMVPLNAVQILFLGMAGDALPAIALAKEPADERVMQQKPRQRAAPVVNRIWWIYGILLNALTVGIGVILLTLVSTYLTTGVWRKGQLREHCVPKGSERNSYCQISEFLFRFQWATHIEFVDNKKTVRILGATQTRKVPGRTFSPSDFGLNLKCDAYDPSGWCQGETVEGTSIIVRQSMIANGLTFLAASFCEMIWPYSIRSWRPLRECFNRSPWLHLAVSIPACATLAVLICPKVNDVMSIRPPTPWQLLVLVPWPVAIQLFCSETIYKPLARKRHAEELLIAEEAPKQTPNDQQ